MSGSVAGMKRIAVALAVIAGCGGGPSVGEVVDPSARIVSSNCQLTGGTVSIDITYDAKVEGGVPNRPIVTIVDEILAPILARRFCGPAVVVV